MPLLRVVNMHMGIQLELNTGGGTILATKTNKKNNFGGNFQIINLGKKYAYE